MLPNHFFSYKKKDENWKKRYPWITLEGSRTYLNTIINWYHCSILVHSFSYFFWKQAKVDFFLKEGIVCFQRMQAKQPIFFQKIGLATHLLGRFVFDPIGLFHFDLKNKKNQSIKSNNLGLHYLDPLYLVVSFKFRLIYVQYKLCLP